VILGDRFISRLSGDLLCVCAEEDFQPLIFPLLRFGAYTPPDPRQCKYMFFSV